MSPKAFTENSQHEYDPPEPVEYCTDCTQFYWPSLGHRCEPRPVERFYTLRLALACILTTAAVLGVLAYATNAHARTGQTQPQPIPAPTALLKARKACPNTASLVECRSALRRAYDAVSWQRHARWQAKASTSRDVVLDAIHWAAAKTGVPAWRMIGIGNCESHLFWLAENGQFKSWAQLSTRHRSDPLIARLTWRDPYAVALHVARYIKAHGEGEWQCQSTGGLRW